MKLNRRSEIGEKLEGIENSDTTIFFGGLDEAVIGIDHDNEGGPRLVYDREKCIRCFMEMNEWDYETAEEGYEFNVACLYAGPQTPLIIETV